VSKALLGRWILWPSHANLWPAERLLRPLYDDPAQRTADGTLPEGAYLFCIATKPE
jgi:hypothetical protein